MPVRIGVVLNPSKRYQTRRGDPVVDLRRSPMAAGGILPGLPGSDPLPWRAVILIGKTRAVHSYTDVGTWSANPVQRSELDLVEVRP